LEIKGFHDVTCHGCGFIGDLVELYAQKSKQSLGSALSELQLANAVTLDAGEAPFYLGDREKNRKLIKVWQKGQAFLREGPAGSIRAILEAHQILFNDHEARRLAVYCAHVRAEDFEDLDIPIEGCVAL
jgi:hypothetical protein